MFVYSFLIPMRIKMQIQVKNEDLDVLYECCKILKYLLLPFYREKYHHLFAEIDKSRYLCTRK